MIMWCATAIFVIFTVRVGAQQHVFDCPSDWINHGTQCYKFVGFPEENFEQAQGVCAIHGAALLSVGSRAEHSLISKTLQAVDPYHRTWYTSGTQKSAGTVKSSKLGSGSDSPEMDADSQAESESEVGSYVWQGDGTVIRFDLQFWLPGIQLGKGGVIAYKYVTEYGWTLVNPGDKLPFICEISQAEAYRIVHDVRDFDYGLQKPDPNNIKKGPDLFYQSQSQVVVGRSQDAVIECIATGNPNPSYRWYRGENMDVEITAGLDSRYTLTNGKLAINSPREDPDGGEYRCTAENEFGLILGDPLTLSFGSLGEFSNVPDAAVRAKAFEGVAIQCSRIAYKPAVKYQWLKGSVRSFVRPSLQPYTFISANGRLYFSEVTRVDEGDYRCIAILSGVNKHTIGTSQPPTRTSLPIQLMVQDQAAKADWGPEIQNDFIAVFPQPPMRGQDVRLECFAYGSSTTPFLYKWKRENWPMPSNVKIMDHNRVLIIENAQLEDRGTYTCTVSRGTSARDTKSIALNLAAKPYFILPLRNQHVDINSQLTWRCVARGNPVPTYTWYKNGKKLEPVPGDIQITGSTLIIFKLNSDRHDGMYQCKAENTHGVKFSSGQVRVLSFKPSFQKRPLPRRTEAALNGNLTIMCNPEGAPQPEISWFRNGVALAVGSHIRQLKNGNLLITGLQLSDQGRYACKAINDQGEATSSTHVTISKSTSITTAPTPTRVIVNQTAFMYCQASYDPVLDMVYVWTFNGHELNLEGNTRYVQELSPVKSGLYIRNADFRHAGVYECIARTTLQEDKQSAELTVIGPPGEPAGVFVEPGSVAHRGAQVKWTPGTSHGRPIKFYSIEALTNFNAEWVELISNLPAEDTVSDEGLKPRTDVEGLKPGTGYRFRLRAINDFGRGEPSVPSAFIQTPAAPPSKAPDNVRGGGGSVGELTIKFDPMPPADHGGPGIGYIIYWRRLQTGGEGGGLWQKGMVTENRDFFVHTVGSDNYFLEYEVKVQAYNDLGRGPNSTIEVIYSADGMPVAVPTGVSSDAYNGTALEVTWTPVTEEREYLKGRVRGYQINYWAQDDVDPIYMRFTRVEGQVDTGIVIGLEQWAMHYVDVQVYNSAGLGPRSEKFVQETVGWAPFTYPQEVRIYSHGPDSVYVWWRGISITYQEETLEGFMLYYWSATEDYRSAEVLEVEMVNEAVIPDLETGKLYALRVAAFSAGGEGKKSPTMYFTLGGSVTIDSSMASSFSIRASASLPVSSLSVVILSCLLVFLQTAYDAIIVQ